MLEVCGLPEYPEFINHMTSIRDITRRVRITKVKNEVHITRENSKFSNFCNIHLQLTFLCLTNGPDLLCGLEIYSNYCVTNRIFGTKSIRSARLLWCNFCAFWNQNFGLLHTCIAFIMQHLPYHFFASTHTFWVILLSSEIDEHVLRYLYWETFVLSDNF